MEYRLIHKTGGKKAKSPTKFYNIASIGRQVMIHFGKIGTEGRLKVRKFTKKVLAAEFVKRKAERKLARGYSA